MTPLSPPVRIGRFEPVILVDCVIRWGPVSVLTARSVRRPVILVEDLRGITPSTFRRTTEPRC